MVNKSPFAQCCSFWLIKALSSLNSIPAAWLGMAIPVAKNRSMTAHYFKLSVDEGQFYAEAIKTNERPFHYLTLSAEQSQITSPL
jgi:hypothetical protein